MDMTESHYALHLMRNQKRLPFNRESKFKNMFRIDRDWLDFLRESTSLQPPSLCCTMLHLPLDCQQAPQVTEATTAAPWLYGDGGWREVIVSDTHTVKTYGYSTFSRFLGQNSMPYQQICLVLKFHFSWTNQSNSPC